MVEGGCFSDDKMGRTKCLLCNYSKYAVVAKRFGEFFLIHPSFDCASGDLVLLTTKIQTKLRITIVTIER